MDAIEYLKAQNRMCKQYLKSTCEECPLENCGCSQSTCNTDDEVKRVVEVVEKWAAEHPAKTRQSELLKLFPEIALDDEGVCKICPNYVARDYKCPLSARHCAECRHKFWPEEVE